MKALAFLAALTIAAPALAATPVTLRADVSDADGVVTLGDLFDGAGPAARTPIATRTGASVILNAAAVRAAAWRAGLDWPNAQGLSTIVVRGGAPAATGVNAVAATSAAVAPRGNVDVLTWTRNIATGDVIQPSDLIWAKAAAAPGDAPSDPDQLVGQAARRALRAGAVAAGGDVAALQVIKQGELVTLTYENEGVSLALQARALTGGAVGDTINVQNVTSKKTVQAVVSGPGQAAVGPAAAELKLARTTRFASAR